MSTLQILILLGLGFLLVGGSILLRVYSQGKYEVKPIDLVFIIMPLLIVGIATGKMTDLGFFGVQADWSALWAEAAETEIEQQVKAAPDSSVEGVMEMATTGSKGGVGEIPRLIQQKTSVLTFNLGMGHYYGPAIAEYFDKLYGSSYLRYVVVNDGNGLLFGMYPANDLVTYFRNTDEYGRLAHSLNAGDQQARDWLAGLPGFIPVELALKPGASKQEALRTMSDREHESLPVVDDSGRFIGTVEREKLTASLILAVTERARQSGGE